MHVYKCCYFYQRSYLSIEGRAKSCVTTEKKSPESLVTVPFCCNSLVILVYSIVIYLSTYKLKILNS